MNVIYTHSPPLVLRMLRGEDERSFLNAIAEFQREAVPWQFAFGYSPSIPFLDYVAQLQGHPAGIGIPANFVPNTFYVGVVGDVIVGRLSLRHSLNEFLATVGGHIGYGVVPSQRRRGYATEMLRQALPLCRPLGLTRALITCDENNAGSRKVIESCGGVFENMIECVESGIPKRRYWIQIP